MTNATTRAAAFVAVVVTGLALLFSGAANAWENHGSGNGGCSSGRAVGNGATLLNTFEFTLCQRSADHRDVTGYFQAAAPLSANVIAPRGPITCSDVEGTDVSFYYPFGTGSVPPPNPALTGIVIYAHDGGATGDTIAFAPVNAGVLPDCSLASPLVTGLKLTALPVTTGGITVTPRA
jgi:hypothetical protein